MIIDLTPDIAMPLLGTLAAAIGGLYGRALAAENKVLRQEIDNLRQQHTIDINRIDACHDDMWDEMKGQRESLSQNKEAIVKLNASIDRLNEILVRIDATTRDKVSNGQCELIRKNYIDLRRNRETPIPGGKRHDDLPEN